VPGSSHNSEFVNSPGWTLDTLALHVTALLAELDRRTQVSLDAQKVAVDAALIAVNERLKLLNELRSLVTDVLAQTVTRVELSTIVEGLRRDVENVTKRVDHDESRSGGIHAGWVVLVSAVVVLGTLVSIYLALRGGR
jgi:hypothetical protein